MLASVALLDAAHYEDPIVNGAMSNLVACFS
jgi:hypothetical protein